MQYPKFIVFNLYLLGIAMTISTLSQCKQNDKAVQVVEEDYVHKSTNGVNELVRLSEYGKFEMPLAAMKPKSDVVPYDLNSSLFTDYAHKRRFIFLPEGTTMTYQNETAFDFPNGSLIFKFFYYPKDFRKPNDDLQHMETRILKKENDVWTALTYVWDEKQTDAQLLIAGKTQTVHWKDENGDTQSVNYSIPNLIQCKSCHEYNTKIIPIGPAARHLNKTYSYAADAKNMNQLDFFVQHGYLKGVEKTSALPKIQDYNDTKVSLDERARAYLDINCAHCHRPEGPARTSALHLLASEKNPVSYGVLKTPIAAGIGTGGLKYDILPGHHEQSILYFRMNSLNPGITMPELGKNMIHKEGLELIKSWIDQMD